MSTKAPCDSREFVRLLWLARSQGWRIPDPNEDSHGPAAWAGYWRALEYNLSLRRSGQRETARPVPPHMPGGGACGPEDMLERAERINHNRATWRGYLP